MMNPEHCSCCEKAAQQNAALQAEHASYVVEVKAALAQRNREADVLRDTIKSLQQESDDLFRECVTLRERRLDIGK